MRIRTLLFVYVTALVWGGAIRTESSEGVCVNSDIGDRAEEAVRPSIKPGPKICKQVQAIIGKEYLEFVNPYASLFQFPEHKMVVMVEVGCSGIWSHDRHGAWIAGFTLRFENQKAAVEVVVNGVRQYKVSGTMRIQTPHAAVALDYIAIITPNAVLAESDTPAKVGSSVQCIWSNVRRVDRILEMTPRRR